MSFPNLFASAMKYVNVAIASAVVDWLVFLTLLEIMYLSSYFALVVARLFGGATSFIFNRLWTFNSLEMPAKKQATRFILLYLISLTLAFFMFIILNKLFVFDTFVSKIVTDGVIFIFNFFVMRFWVYTLFHKI